MFQKETFAMDANRLPHEDAGTPEIDPAKAEAMKQFIESVGGIENAKRALRALAEIERDAA
jgi:hypothetical protein